MQHKPAIRVLIVTDIPDSITEISRIMAGQPDFIVVGSTTDAAQALDLVKVHQPDIAIMDYDMPGLDGAEVSRAILRHDETVLIIMLSLVNDPADIRHAMRAGARDYLIKPIDESELLETIRWLLSERREYARMQAFVGQLRKAYEALFTDDKPVPPKVIAYLEEQVRAAPDDRLPLETLAVSYARNREWRKLANIMDDLLELLAREGESA